MTSKNYETTAAAPVIGSSKTRQRDWNAHMASTSAAGAANSKKGALSAAYAELGKELTSGKLRSVGTYTLGRSIGEGTYGKVRLGTHRLTGLRVAIKQVPKAHVANLTREIHHHRHLHHPHIMQLYEVLATESYVWMVSELCAGGELYDYLVERGTMPEPEARRIFGQLCLAVAYIHQRGIVHRDLKLENVLLDERCNVKLGDFGFTREFEGKKLMETFCGTTGYAAPEMLAGRKYTGEGVDIWSLGIILYALVYGTLPFDDDDELVMKAKILDGEYELPEGASPECANLVKGILQQDPSARPSIREILSSPWFSKVIMPPLMMETVDEDVADGQISSKDGHTYADKGAGQVTAASLDATALEDDAHIQRSVMTSSVLSNASYQSANSQPESEASDYQSSKTDSTAPTTAGEAMPEKFEEPEDASLPLTLQHRNESQTTIRRQASASSDGSRKAQYALPKSASTSLATHVETPLENMSPNEYGPRRNALSSVPLEKRGSQSSARSQAPHRTPSRTKRRSSSGLSDHHPPSLESRPIDYFALLERSTPAIFSTVLEQNLLHQLSSLGMDVGQIVHSVVNEACDASGAMWWLLKKKEEERARIEKEAGLGSMPSSPYVSSVRPLSPPHQLESKERRDVKQDSSHALPQEISGLALNLDGPSQLASRKDIDTQTEVLPTPVITSKSVNIGQEIPNYPARRAPLDPKRRAQERNDASASSPSLTQLATMQPTMGSAPATPPRNRAASIGARISSVLSGRDKDKDKESRRDATADASVSSGSREGQDDRTNSAIGSLFAGRRSSTAISSPLQVSDKRKGKEKNVESAQLNRTDSMNLPSSASVSHDLSLSSAESSAVVRSKSIDTFSTVTSSGDGHGHWGMLTENRKRSGRSSFLNTVRNWLGTEDKKTETARQKKRASKKQPLNTIHAQHPVSHIGRTGSVRKHAMPSPVHATPPQYSLGGTASRQASRGKARANLSRNSSSGSMQHMPRPVNIRRQSAGSITPTATIYGLTDDFVHMRHSRPSSAQSHRNATMQSGLRGKSGSTGSTGPRLRHQKFSSGSGGGGMGPSHYRGVSSHRSSIDGGTVVRRQRPAMTSRSNSATNSRPTTPSRGRHHSGELSVDTVTPRRSLDSGRGSPLTLSRLHGSQHSVFVAHRTRNHYKPPSHSVPKGQRKDGIDVAESTSVDDVPSHARRRGSSDGYHRYRYHNPHIGTWRRSWGKPPPTWSGPVDHAREDSTSIRIEEAQARDRAKLRDIFANNDDAKDEWEDEEDEPVYAGGLGQLASNTWRPDAADGRAVQNSFRTSPRLSPFQAMGANGMDEGAWGARRVAPPSRTFFQPPSLGRETTPRGWVPAGPTNTQDAGGSENKEGQQSSEGATGEAAAKTTPASGQNGPAGSRIRSAAPVFQGQTITEEEEDE